MFYICCCLHAHYCMLFSDLRPVYITLIGKFMLRKVLISLWHQFIGHGMTCEVCDSKHLCYFNFVFSSLLIYFDFSRSWFRFKTPICLQGVNSTFPITWQPELTHVLSRSWFLCNWRTRSNHPRVQEKHLANSCVSLCGEQGGQSGRRLGGKDCKERLPTCFTLVRRLNFLYFRKMKDLTKDKFI